MLLTIRFDNFLGLDSHLGPLLQLTGNGLTGHWRRLENGSTHFPQSGDYTGDEAGISLSDAAGVRIGELVGLTADAVEQGDHGEASFSYPQLPGSADWHVEGAES
ncbi:hypothetical protein QU481_07650 [Crenobacter sp. SG2303]|uniref:Uncharacterized protein n=1 Tax=Crenobacter oryzisoli TaxID=3056844 RepID=A0ABT7XLY6_9NEIS|nr:MULTISPECIES: hypothetical protein [unclassified Crenobacter]MDN0074765.1 hypothetical protein [Crenobacter sp. SG2303]MDN0084151.1 hypothetical protein [Crenobacter sp. SG2305]